MNENPRVELRALKVEWNDGRTERLFASVQDRIDRRRVALRAVFASAALLTLLAAAFLVLRPHPTSDQRTAGSPSGRVTLSGTIRLREGSEIQPSSAESEVRVVEEAASRVLVEQVRGSARYSVVQNPARTFEVRSGPVIVRVIGTEFTVERRTDGTRVEVSRGKVSVSSGTGNPEALLLAGESGLFPPAKGAMGATPVTGAASEPEAEAAAPREGEVARAYGAHVTRRDYRGAFALLSRHPALAGDSVEDLLVAADVARLSNHPSEAVPYLQRIIREHSRDERAPLAAFTLGRTLSGLGRTREALNMFGRVRSDWANSPLSEEALLRQAEAASRLGEIGTAVRLAEEYDRVYPQGRRRAEVRRFARLE
jgi:transmembrane sensor